MGNTLNTASKIGGGRYKENVNGTVIEAIEDYQVMTAISATAATALGASGLPAIGAAHPTHSAIYVVDRSPKQDEGGTRWVVTVKYGRPSGYSEGAYSSRVVEYGSWGSTEDLVTDQQTGAAILNSAGDPFEDTVQVPRQYRQWIIRIHKSSATISTIMAQSDTVNSASVTMPDGTALAARTGYLTCDVSEPAGGGVDITYTVRKRVRNVKLNGSDVTDIGWDEAIMQQGYLFKSGSDKLRYMEPEMDVSGAPKLDESGSPVLRPSAKPCLLNADGTLNTSGVPLFIRVAVFPESSWSLT